jgi:hypothetical protein
MLETLEWLAKYGFIDIIFGVGIFGLAWKFLRKFVHSNYSHLHVSLSRGDQMQIHGEDVDSSIRIDIRNSGSTNFYIARAYFKEKLRPWWLLWFLPIKTKLKVHPSSDRISDKDAYELKFSGSTLGGLTEYEALVTPGHGNGVTTFLALTENAADEIIQNRKCGVLYIEYAVSGKQGIHRVRL